MPLPHSHVIVRRIWRFIVYYNQTVILLLLLDAVYGKLDQILSWFWLKVFVMINSGLNLFWTTLDMDTSLVLDVTSWHILALNNRCSSKNCSRLFINRLACWVLICLAERCSSSSSLCVCMVSFGAGGVALDLVFIQIVIRYGIIATLILSSIFIIITVTRIIRWFISRRVDGNCFWCYPTRSKVFIDRYESCLVPSLILFEET